MHKYLYAYTSMHRYIYTHTHRDTYTVQWVNFPHFVCISFVSGFVYCAAN